MMGAVCRKINHFKEVCRSGRSRRLHSIKPQEQQHQDKDDIDKMNINSSNINIKIGWRNCYHTQGNLQIAKSHEYQFGTCECTDFKISSDQCSYTLGLFYRAEDHPFLSFINDMVEYNENNITDKSEFLLLGDFNIHINKLHDDEATTFHDFLNSFGLQNHIMFPTYKSQNTLDLFFTHESPDIMSHFFQGEMISDHFAVHFTMYIPSKARHERIIKFRKVKEIDASSFAIDLQKALVPLTSPDLDELSKLMDGYN